MNLKQRAVMFAFPALLLAAAAYFIISLWPSSPAETPEPKRPALAPKPKIPKLPPVIVVEASFPGGDSWTVANTVGAPIELAFHDLEKRAHLTSSASASRYVLHITFEGDVDLDHALLDVCERVNRTQAFMPPSVTFSVKRQSPYGPILVAVHSPNASRNNIFLSTYATDVVRPQLSALAGVAEVACFGEVEQSIRIIPDTAKLQAFKLSVADFVQAFDNKNQPASGGVMKRGADKLVIADPPKDQANAAQPLESVADVEALIIHKTARGDAIRVKDLAQVELTAWNWDSWALLNGKPAVLLALHVRHNASPDDVLDAVKKSLAKLQGKHPDGLNVELAFDLTRVEETPSFRALDLSFRPASSVEASVKSCEAFTRELKHVEGVGDVLAFAEDATPNTQACVLIGLKGSRAECENTARAVRERSRAIIPAERARWHDPAWPLGFPRHYFPLEMAIVGPKADKVREFAGAFVKRLEKSKKVTPVSADLTLEPLVELQIDRAAAQEFGVSVPAIVNRYGLHAAFSSLNTKHFVIDSARGGRGKSIVVQVDLPRHGNLLQGKDGEITNDKGEKIPLSKVAKYNMFPSPVTVDRRDGEPMVRITADPASGVSWDEASRICESVAEEVRNELRLPATYRLTWLGLSAK
jgi:multidrug efflux pump subunit AcrB